MVGHEHESDAWTVAQRWYDAIAKAQAGNRQPLALMVVYEGQPPAKWRRHAYLALCSDLTKPRPKASLDEVAATYARMEVKRLERSRKSSAATQRQVAKMLGITDRTLRDVLEYRGAYKRQRLKVKPIAER